MFEINKQDKGLFGIYYLVSETVYFSVSDIRICQIM